MYFVVLSGTLFTNKKNIERNKDMATSKKRTQISLNDETYKILEEIASKMGISKSAVVAMLLVNEKSKQTSKRK